MLLKIVDVLYYPTVWFQKTSLINDIERIINLLKTLIMLVNDSINRKAFIHN